MSRKIFFVFVLFALVLSACSQNAPVATSEPQAQPQAQPVQTSGYGATLKATADRGKLLCGVNTTSPAFAYVDASGNYSGMEIDLCRAVASAVLGDASKVDFIPTTNENRFTTLQNGEHDVLIRSTTHTFTRDIELGLNFGMAYLHDGQGFETAKDANFATLEDFAGATICINRGSTSELNLADVLGAKNIEYEQVLYDNANDMYSAFEQGRCDVISTDKSSLISERGLLSDPTNFKILDMTISKEPLGPVVRHGDDQWFDIVNWTFYAMLIAEEHGVTQANVDDMKANSQDAEVRRLLGVEGEMGAKLGLSNDWAYSIIKNVGNYSEVFNRYFGPDTDFAMERGLDALWTDGGLLYAPPLR